MAQALAKSNQTDKAIAEYDTAAKLEPANASTYYFNEGAVLTNTGKVDDAIAAFDKVIAADPTKADAYYWKGVNHGGQGEDRRRRQVRGARGHRRGLQQVPGTAAGRKVCRSGKADAADDRRTGDDQLRLGKKTTSKPVRSRSSRREGGCGRPFRCVQLDDESRNRH